MSEINHNRGDNRTYREKPYNQNPNTHFKNADGSKKICMKFQNGLCQFGDSCKMEHTKLTEGRPMNYSSNHVGGSGQIPPYGVCRSYNKGGCASVACTFAHYDAQYNQINPKFTGKVHYAPGTGQLLVPFNNNNNSNNSNNSGGGNPPPPPVTPSGNRNNDNSGPAGMPRNNSNTYQNPRNSNVGNRSHQNGSQQSQQQPAIPNSPLNPLNIPAQMNPLLNPLMMQFAGNPTLLPFLHGMMPNMQTDGRVSPSAASNDLLPDLEALAAFAEELNPKTLEAGHRISASDATRLDQLLQRCYPTLCDAIRKVREAGGQTDSAAYQALDSAIDSFLSGNMNRQESVEDVAEELLGQQSNEPAGGSPSTPAPATFPSSTDVGSKAEIFTPSPLPTLDASQQSAQATLDLSSFLRSNPFLAPQMPQMPTNTQQFQQQAALAALMGFPGNFNLAAAAASLPGAGLPTPALSTSMTDPSNFMSLMMAAGLGGIPAAPAAPAAAGTPDLMAFMSQMLAQQQGLQQQQGNQNGQNPPPPPPPSN